MRFTEQGPDIPEFLLQERNKGNVVFFCGAGVSFPAGLPGFMGLTEKILNSLGAAEDSPAFRLFNQAKEFGEAGPSLDQVFTALFQKYRKELVITELNRLLRTPKNAPTLTHETVLKLSSNAAGSPQVVTTNFDLLFEKASKTSIDTYVPPALPDIGSGQSIDGLVYLHGRLKPKNPSSITENRLIISSADFGRAYLAEAWATRFVRDLLRNYVIVLLGYRAGDPPVKYLLEGLHARGDGQTLPIYAFDEGSRVEVLQNWLHRGVTPIPYSRIDETHSGLWQTLSLWADQVQAPEEWSKSVIKLAQTRPNELKPHQRGQVATLITDKRGSRQFADADPAPPAQWITVFDSLLRCPKPSPHKWGMDSAPQEDWTNSIRLDRDPDRHFLELHPEVKPEDFIESLAEERHDVVPTRIAGYRYSLYGRLPSRLFDMARWFESQINSPTLLWWIAGYSSVSAELLRRIEHVVSHKLRDLHPNAQKGWSLAWEAFKYSPPSEMDEEWYQTQQRLNKGDVSNGALRQFERATKPYISLSRVNSFDPLLDENDWDKLTLEKVISINVCFPGNDYSALKVPEENKLRIYSIVRSNLALATELLEDADTYYWKTPTFHREDGKGERYFDDAAKYLFWFRELLDEAVRVAPGYVRADFDTWKSEDAFFFDKLRIYLLMNPVLFSGKEVATLISEMSTDTFWRSDHRRELLHTLRARWAEFPKSKRKAVEERIIQGPQKYQGEDDAEYRSYASATSATILGWLERNSCSLSTSTVSRLPEIQRANKNWNESWIDHADESGEGRSGWVKTEKDPQSLEDLPIGAILAAAEENTREPLQEFVRYVPFSGLIEKAPLKAISALTYEAKKGNYPWRFWREVVSGFPETVPIKLYIYFCRRLARLPHEGIRELKYDLPRLILSRFEAFFSHDQGSALEVWDAIASGILEWGPDATKSSIGDTLQGGQTVERSRKTAEHSLNSPIGQLTVALFRALDGLKQSEKSGLPDIFKERFNLLLDAPGEGKHHFVCETTERIRWLNYIDPVWITKEVVPLFDHAHELSEAAWNGFLHTNTLPGPNLFKQLKKDFLTAIETSDKWHWGNGAKDRLYDFLVIACYWNRKDRPYITYAEARQALQNTSDAGRSRVAWFLGDVVKEQKAWRTLGKPFIEQAWPREQEFTTPATAKGLANLVEDAGDTFEEVVETILPYLAPVEHLHVLFRRLKDSANEQDIAVPQKYPRATLRFLDRLVPDDPFKAPHNLNLLIEQIADGDPSVRQDPVWRRLNDIASP